MVLRCVVCIDVVFVIGLLVDMFYSSLLIYGVVLSCRLVLRICVLVVLWSCTLVQFCSMRNALLFGCNVVRLFDINFLLLVCFCLRFSMLAISLPCYHFAFQCSPYLYLVITAVFAL